MNETQIPLISQIKDQIRELTNTFVEKLLNNSYIVFFDENNNEMFKLTDDDEINIESTSEHIQVFMDVTAKRIVPYCEQHWEEPVHFITSFSIYSNADELLVSSMLNTPQSVATKGKNFTFIYKFNLNFH